MSKRSFIAGLVLGAVIAFFIIPFGFKLAFKDMLFKEVHSSFGFEKTVSLITDRLNQQKGWHVTNVINQEQVLLDNGGSEVGKVKIIKFCNAKLSSKMLKDDDRKYMSVKMPLSISVYEKSDGKTYITIMNMKILGLLFGDVVDGITTELAPQMEKMVTLKPAD